MGIGELARCIDPSQLHCEAAVFTARPVTETDLAPAREKHAVPYADQWPVVMIDEDGIVKGLLFLGNTSVINIGIEDHKMSLPITLVCKDLRQDDMSTSATVEIEVYRRRIQKHTVDNLQPRQTFSFLVGREYYEGQLFFFETDVDAADFFYSNQFKK